MEFSNLIVIFNATPFISYNLGRHARGMSLEIAWDTSCIYMYTIFFTTPNYEYPIVIHILLV